MEPSWWLLPGPSRFLERISDDLAQGNNCVLCIPTTMATGIRDALADFCDGRGLGSWNTLDDIEAATSPFECLLTRFSPDSSQEAARNLDSLVTQDAFQGRLIWIEHRKSEEWFPWRDFLIEYERRSRDFSLLSRTLFCIVLVGMPARFPPPEEVSLRVHRWHSDASPLDALLYAGVLMRDRELSPLQYEIGTRIVANLSMWDPSVAQRLAAEDLPTIFSPAAVLLRISSERGWTSVVATPFEELWADGKAGYFDRGSTMHPISLSGAALERAIAHALWSAQVSVLLPLIEKLRQELIGRLSGILKVPFVTRFGEVVNDIAELEIGHIEKQVLDQRAQVDRRTILLVARLREARNLLSHLSCLSLEFIRNLEILTDSH